MPFSNDHLYASLSSYDGQRNERKPSAWLDWIRTLSRDYHRSSQPPLLGRNTGNRSLNPNEVAERLENRMINLVGGYYDKRESEKKVSRSKQRTKKQQRIKLRPYSDPALARQQGVFVEQMYELWKEYMAEVLGDAQTVDEIKAVVHKNQDMEWIGSKVVIHSSRSRRAWQGREGILVQETPETWVLWSTDKQNRFLQVPKRDTVFAISLDHHSILLDGNQLRCSYT